MLVRMLTWIFIVGAYVGVILLLRFAGGVNAAGEAIGDWARTACGETPMRAKAERLVSKLR
jgi:hypothetical protein